MINTGSGTIGSPLIWIQSGAAAEMSGMDLSAYPDTDNGVFFRVGGTTSDAYQTGGTLSLSGNNRLYDFEGDFEIRGEFLISGGTTSFDGAEIDLHYGGITVESGTLEMKNRTVIRVADDLGSGPLFTVKNGGVLKLMSGTDLDLSGLGNETAVKVESGGTLIIDRALVSQANGSNPEAFIILDGGELQIINNAVVQFNQNTSTSGNIIRMTGGKLTVDGSRISNNTVSASEAAGCGGVICTKGTDIVITNSQLKDNTGNNVGVLSAENSAVFQVSNNVISGNKASYSAAVFYAAETAVTIGDGNQVTNNRTENYGGFLRVVDGSVAVGDNNIFQNNQGIDRGGVICAESSPVVIGNDNTFSENRTGRESGGAVYLKDGDFTLGNNNTFYKNFSASGGGAVSVSDANNVIIGESNLFDSNRALSPGGVFHTYGANIHIGPDNQFVNNRADVSGGAIYDNFSGDHMLTIEPGVIFSENSSASYGGAVMAYGGTVKIDGVRFMNNRAESNGGALFFGSYDLGRESSLDAYITNTAFIGNSADGSGSGGAVYLGLGCRLRMDKLAVAENTASLKGGGIYVTADGTYRVLPRDGDAFLSNTARGSDKEDKYSETNAAVDDADVMFNGGRCLWTVSGDGEGQRHIAEPDNTNISAADVLMRGNSAPYGGAIYARGTLEVGQDGVDFTARKFWTYEQVIPENTPEPADLLKALTIYANGSVFDTGEITQNWVEENKYADGDTAYGFGLSADAFAEIEVIDTHDYHWDIRFKSFPRQIDGQDVVYTIGENLPDYDAEITGNMTDGFEIINRYVIEPSETPTPTEAPTDVPLPTETTTVSPPPDSEVLYFFRLFENLETLPNTGLSD